MLFRKQLMKQPLFHDAVRSVFDALTPLVAHHVLLVRKVGLVQFVRQITHAVGLQPKRQFQLVRRQRFEIIRAVEIRRAVDVRSARRFQEMNMRAARHVPRSFKHHVLEQMRKPGAPRQFVRRTDVIPEVDRHQWQPVVFGENHLQAVLQLVFFESQLRHFEWRGLGRSRLCSCLGRRFFSRVRRPRLRLRARRIRKGHESKQTQRQCILPKKPHYGILSIRRNLTRSQRTAAADVLKARLLAYLCSATVQALCDFGRGQNVGQFAQAAAKLVYCQTWFA